MIATGVPSSRWRAVTTTLVLLVGSPAPKCAAQEFLTIEFSLANPGARSLGFGGAFVALADDATAAFANPAGLVQIVRPELSLEGRARSYSTVYTQGGRVSATPSGSGLDTLAGLRTGESSADTADLSFLSFVYPVKRWSFAFYRHQLASFESTLETQGLFGEGSESGNVLRAADLRTWTDLKVVTLAVSGAYRLSDGFSLGIGVVHFQGKIDTVKDRHLWDEDTVASFFAVNSYLPERLVDRTLTQMDDTDWGLTVGFLGSLSKRLRVGGSFRQGPTMALNISSSAGPAFRGVDVGSTLFSVSTPLLLPPDVYSVGVAYRFPGDRLTVSAEWNRVEYSEMVGSLDPAVAADAEVTMENADEIHLGAEYAFFERAGVFALRAGVWLDPEHRLHSTSDDVFEQAIFRPGEDELHYAIGVGVTFGRIQLDLAADSSDLADTVAFSLISSF